MLGIQSTPAETPAVASLMPWVRNSGNGEHRRVIDLLVDSKFRCICLDCWKSWVEGGECGECKP
jgi:hypothetical protein